MCLYRIRHSQAPSWYYPYELDSSRAKILHLSPYTYTSRANSQPPTKRIEKEKRECNKNASQYFLQDNQFGLPAVEAKSKNLKGRTATDYLFRGLER